MRIRKLDQYNAEWESLVSAAIKLRDLRQSDGKTVSSSLP